LRRSVKTPISDAVTCSFLYIQLHRKEGSPKTYAWNFIKSIVYNECGDKMIRNNSCSQRYSFSR